MAIACLRLFTVPPDPLFSVPCLPGLIADLTVLDEALLYLAMHPLHRPAQDVAVTPQPAGLHARRSMVRANRARARGCRPQQPDLMPMLSGGRMGRCCRRRVG